jgi:hypothetical protein
VGHIRIVCKWPEQPKGPGLRVGLMPSIVDTEVFVVHDDGSETPLDGVTSVRWCVSEPNMAQAEITVAADVDVVSTELVKATR